MMNFEFVTATRIIFGEGEHEQIGTLAADFGTQALVTTGGTPERATPLIERLKAAGVAVDVLPVPGEPTVAGVREGAQRARQSDCEVVIGIGGGSPIDAAKAIAALATNGGDPLDYLEVIGQGQPLTVDPLPTIAVPTTSGTGAEVAKNSVLKSEEHNVKVSLRHPKLLPNVALVDPVLTHSVPPNVTAYTGMDALAQVLEPYVTHQANPLTDAIAIEGLRRAARSLRRVYADGSDTNARADMALASLFGGLALTNAKLGAAHGFAGPLGGLLDAPHGGIVAALLPVVMETNIALMRQREPDNPALVRYNELAVLLTRRPDANAEDGVAWVRETTEMLDIPTLGDYGLTESHFPAAFEKAKRSSSMRGNPITLTEADMRQVLEKAL